jgi:hypothetical protein
MYLVPIAMTRGFAISMVMRGLIMPKNAIQTLPEATVMDTG